MPSTTKADRGSPASLVAIVVGARRAGDRELERLTRDELHRRYGIRLTFARPTPQSGGKGVPDAK